MTRIGRFVRALHNMVLVFWVGGVWVTGYIVAPSLFSNLDDRRLAGTVAGEIFSIMGWIGLGASLLLLLYYWFLLKSRWRSIVTLIMGGLVAANLFIVSPELAAIRDAASGALAAGSEEYRRFAYLHGISSGVFLLISLLGLLLVARIPASSPPGERS